MCCSGRGEFVAFIQPGRARPLNMALGAMVTATHIESLKSNMAEANRLVRTGVRRQLGVES